MKRAELLALIAGLRHMDLGPCTNAADFLRQIVQSQPVAWRFEVRGIKPATDWKLYNVTHSKVAVTASVRATQSEDIEGRAVPLYTLPLED